PLGRKPLWFGIEPRGVSEIGVDRLCRRGFVPQVEKPVWRLRMAAAGVNDQIGAQGRGAALLPSLAQLDATPTPTIRRGEQSGDLGSGDDLDFGPLRDALTHVPLQQRAAETDGLWLLWQRQQPFGRNDGKWNPVGGRGGTILTQLVDDTGKELLKDGKGGGKQ